MPSKSLLLTPAALQQDGPCIFVLISTTRYEFEEGTAVGLDFPQARVRALIDTGASITVINPEVARSCKLRQTGIAQLVAANSSGSYPEHAAAISFPDSELKGFEAIKVVACPIVRQPYSCLIGRDILRKWALIYEGSKGRVSVQD